VTGASRAALLIAAALSTVPAFGADREPRCGEISGNPERAIQVCTRWIEYGSLPRADLAQAYYTRGAEWAGQSNHDRAIADYSMAIELDPKLASAYLNRALSWSEKGDSDRAIADYDTAIKLVPKDVRAHMGRAVEWTVRGEYKRALADYEEIIRLDPKSLTGYFGRARVRFYAGDFAGATADFSRAHEIDPGMYTALWLYLARKRAGVAGEKTLAKDAGTGGTGDWPAPIVALYLGSATPEAVQKAANAVNVTRHRTQRCEANFYVAHWQLMRGAHEPAAQLLRDARTICPSSFIEHEGAVAELKRLEKR
jgi:lipoprotein NlpI